MLVAYSGLSWLALNAVLTYDLFARHDLTIPHKTVLAVVIWIKFRLQIGLFSLGTTISRGPTRMIDLPNIWLETDLRTRSLRSPASSAQP